MIENLFKILYNIGHIIYYKLYDSYLSLMDIEIPIPSPFSVMSIHTMKPKPIDNYKPYDGPTCKTP